MKTRTKVSVGSFVSLVALLAVLVAGLVSAAPPNVPPGLARAAAAQERHTDALLAKDGVVGTAVGLAADGQPVVKIYTNSKSAPVHGLPTDLDGIPVEVEETGELVAQQSPSLGIGNSSGTERLITVQRSLYCTVGTLGMLLTDGTNRYALSNAHVYANVGSKTYGGPVRTGARGDRILQPGRVDLPTPCGTQGEINDAVIGNLWAYTSVSFSLVANNQVDAAIAKLSSVGSAKVASTFSDLEAPSKDPAPTATVVPPLPVKKYGRTTGLTHGAVSAINATVLIQYDTGLARFVGQVVVAGAPDPFSDSGDSGSLIMTEDGNHPVALLFAGSSSTTIGNPIDKVLARFPGLSIVGQ